MKAAWQIGVALHCPKRGLTDHGVLLTCKITSPSSTINIPYCFEIRLYSLDLTFLDLLRSLYSRGKVLELYDPMMLLCGFNKV